MTDPVVRQSPKQATRYEVEIGSNEVILDFLSASKGRMDFVTMIDGIPQGKCNLLSQHSIKRLAKDCVTPHDIDKFVLDLLRVGIIMRDGTFEPAPIVDRIEAEAESYDGSSSSYGEITESVVDDFLSEPHLLDKINDILHQSRDVPFVGDDANLMLTFLVMLSCKADSPLNLEMIGQSAAGKTYLTLTARNGFPKSMILVLAGASKEALKYDYDEVDEDGNFIVNVGGRCIIVLEKDESYAFVRKMKPLMSGDDTELVWKTPMKNDLTGEIETRDFIIRGQPSFITLTTRNPTEAEQVTRQLLMTPDSSGGKVKEVVANALIAKARPEHFEVHPDLQLLQAAMLNLDKYRVRNIFAPIMADFFPARNAQHQRDIGKVLSVIDAVTLLHQHQRPVQKDGDDEFLLSSVEDNAIGLLLCDLVLRASLSGVPDDTWAVFAEMQNMDDSSRALTEDNILQWVTLHAHTVSKNALKEKHLPTLEDAGLIEVKRRGGGRGGAKKTYRLVKTRLGLMDSYALAPLFVEACRTMLDETVNDFDDVLSTSNAPAHTRRINKTEATILRGLGCESSDESKVYRSLFLPNYLRPTGKSPLLSMMVGDSVHKGMLFSGTAWFEGVDVATEGLEARRDLKETLKESSMAAVDIDDDATWDAFMEAHLDDLDED